MSAPVRNPPTAKKTEATKFTSNPKNVRMLGLIPVAAMAPTILSSSHLPPAPIPPVNVIAQRIVSQNAYLLRNRKDHLHPRHRTPGHNPQQSAKAGMV